MARASSVSVRPSFWNDAFAGLGPAEKKKLPDGVLGVQLPTGSKGGTKFVEKPSPAAVEALMSSKGATHLWAELKVKLGETYSGGCFKVATVNPVLDSYKDKFAEKGLEIFYLATNTTIGFGGEKGTASSTALYNWLEIKDVKKLPDYVPTVPPRKVCIIQ